MESKYLFDNFQGVTGDRGPVGNQGPRGYPVSLSLCDNKGVFCIYVYDRNMCCSVYLRQFFLEDALYYANIHCVVVFVFIITHTIRCIRRIFTLCLPEQMLHVFI